MATALMRVLRFLGWIDRRPYDCWPFPFGWLGPSHGFSLRSGDRDGRDV